MAISNYDKARDAASAHFAEYDQQKMIDKFALDHDGEYIYINFTGARYSVDRLTGEVTVDGKKAGYNEAMSIYDVLCCSKDDCRLSGRYIDLQNAGGAVRSSVLTGAPYLRASELFTGHTVELSAACESIGGVKTTVGDVAYILPAFDFLPMVLRFWDADDEFPANLRILWDENFPDFIRYETAHLVTSHVLETLSAHMQISGK